MRYVCVGCDREYDEPVAACPVDGAPVVQRGDATQGLVGARLDGRFQVEALLGQGGMGTVYRGTQVSVGRPVAIKVLRPDVAQSEDLVRRFYREARVISRLNHPNIVSLIDFGATPDGMLYLVMEFVRGTTLLEEMQRGPIRTSRSVRIATQVCDALAEAHAQGIIHRDLKPENIVLTEHATRRDFVKVLDFGIATAVDECTRGATITAAGSVIGTPAYMSPEQVSGESKLTAAADLYSLTLILFEMLTGRRVFSAEAPATVMVQQVTQAPQLLRDVAPDRDFPEQLEAVLHRTLAKRKEDRVQDASAYKAELAEVAQGRDYVPGANVMSDFFVPTNLMATPEGAVAADELAQCSTEDDIEFLYAQSTLTLEQEPLPAGRERHPSQIPDLSSRGVQSAPETPAQPQPQPVSLATKAVDIPGIMPMLPQRPAQAEAAEAPQRRGQTRMLVVALAAAGVAALAIAGWSALRPAGTSATRAAGPAAPRPPASPALPAVSAAQTGRATPAATPAPPLPVVAAPTPPEPAAPAAPPAATAQRAGNAPHAALVRSHPRPRKNNLGLE